MKKLILIFGFVFILSIIGIFGYSYIQYNNLIEKRNIDNGYSQSNFETEIENNQVIGNIYNNGSDYLYYDGDGYIPVIESTSNRKGAVNPAYEFRNISTGELTYYFDHDGKILASNITVQKILVVGNNITVEDYGFFEYLGDSLSKITKGWFTNLDVTNLVNTSFLNASQEIYINTLSVKKWLYNMSDGSYNATYNTWLSNYTEFSRYWYNMTGTTTDSRWNLSGTNLFPQSLSFNVGIGKSTPTATLDVNGNITAIYSIISDYFITQANNNYSEAPIYGMGLSNYTITGSSNPAIQIGSFNGIIFTTDSATPKIVINKSGSIGIGTVLPSALLDIEAARATIQLNNTNAGGNYWNIQSGDTTNDSRLLFYSGLSSIRPLILYQDKIIFNGSVGIGIVNPTNQLHLFSPSSTPQLKIQNTYDTGGSGSAEIALNSTGREWRIGVGSSASDTLSIQNKTYIYDLQANAIRFVIDTLGRVGIGTSTPSAKLEVAGDINISTGGNLTIGSGKIFWNTTSNSLWIQVT